MAKIVIADTEEFKYAVEHLEEYESPEFIGLLKMLACLLPEGLNAGSFMKIYDQAFSMVCDIEDLEPERASRLHFYTILFMDESFPEEFSDLVAKLISEKYLPA